MGVASRRKAEELIFGGKVEVNGEKVLVPQTLVDPAQDKIVVDGKAPKEIEKKVYYLLNKPVGYVCTALITTHSKSVLELFEGVKERLFTVGRLDKNTSGLLIVTNDGHFANSIIHPSNEIEKEYLAKTGQEITHEHLVKLSGGALVEGVFVKPLKVSKVRRGTLKIVLAEGKKREVRRLLEAVGLDAQELTRIRIGGLVLGSLPIGEFRPLTKRDKELLLKNED